MTTSQPEAPALAALFRRLEADHDPEGWPAIRARTTTAGEQP